MNNERYNQIIDEAYENYCNHFMDEYLEKNELGESYRNSLIPHPIEKFIGKIINDPEFSEKWGLKIEERELTLEERYNKWFNNNYETGMERYFDPNDLPDFNDPYYEPTPTKVTTVTYQGEKIEVYE